MGKVNAFTLSLEQIHNFNDDVTTDFDSQLSGIVSDCRKRPACNKSRTVTLKLEAKPSQQDPDDVVLSLVVTSKIPAAKYIDRLARSTPRNQLQLQFDHSDDIEDDDDDDKKKNK